MTAEKFYVYGLQDPRTEEFYYVGQTCNPRQRLTDHRSTRVKGNKDAMQRSKEIIAAGLQLRMIVMKKAIKTRKDALVVEQEVIKRLTSLGHGLMNKTSNANKVVIEHRDLSAIQPFNTAKLATKTLQ